MNIYQSKSFEKKIKKLSKQNKAILDQEIRKIINNPAIGKRERGNLKEIFVHKYKDKTVQYLLAYRLIGDDLELIMIGPHENYYRYLKNYLNNR